MSVCRKELMSSRHEPPCTTPLAFSCRSRETGKNIGYSTKADAEYTHPNLAGRHPNCDGAQTRVRNLSGNQRMLSPKVRIAVRLSTLQKLIKSFFFVIVLSSAIGPSFADERVNSKTDYLEVAAAINTTMRTYHYNLEELDSRTRITMHYSD